MRKTEDKTKTFHQKSQIANVLIVDKDPDLVQSILRILARKGIRGIVANDACAAADLLERENYDLVFTTVKVGQKTNYDPKSNYVFELLQKVRQNSPEMPFIMIGDCPSQEDSSSELIEAAVQAIRAGCKDFIPKPIDTQKVECVLNRFLPNHSVSTLASADEDTHSLYQIVGRSTKLMQTISLAKKIAPTSAPVLISGESGTGKELISYMIHRQSKRAQGPYVKVNCAALSGSLLESELFGHEKGAFTGAYAQRKGRFEMAHGGTLLLDEITETPPKFQAKLLRILEQQDFERVGGNENIKINVRIISTTNKDLLQEVIEERFRRDLYYRLSGVRLIIAPLRERHEDLPDLIWHFVNLYARESQRHITELDCDMVEIFKRYHWPGNVRQLRNVVRTSLILGSSSILSLADVSWLFDELQPRPQGNKAASDLLQRNTYVRLGGLPLVQVEKQAILETLRQTEGNQTKAAKVLGISDRTLRGKIRQYREEGVLQTA